MALWDLVAGKSKGKEGYSWLSGNGYSVIIRAYLALDALGITAAPLPASYATSVRNFDSDDDDDDDGEEESGGEDEEGGGGDDGKFINFGGRHNMISGIDDDVDDDFLIRPRTGKGAKSHSRTVQEAERQSIGATARIAVAADGQLSGISSLPQRLSRFFVFQASIYSSLLKSFSFIFFFASNLPPLLYVPFFNLFLKSIFFHGVKQYPPLSSPPYVCVCLGGASSPQGWSPSTGRSRQLAAPNGHLHKHPTSRRERS
jgi:hypothetical protein